jgi:hypothetical protein
MPSPFAELDARFPSLTNNLALYRQVLSEREHIPGDLAEFGVYNGGGVRQMAAAAPNRTVWAFDTFTGMPAEDYGGLDDADNPPGRWKPFSLDPAELFAGIPNVRIMAGRFAETLPLVPPDVRFVLVHVDCDFYESHMQVFRFLEQRMQPGGFIWLDDPQLPGAFRAMRKWATSQTAAHWNGGHIIEWMGAPCPQPSAV